MHYNLILDCPKSQDTSIYCTFAKNWGCLYPQISPLPPLKSPHHRCCEYYYYGEFHVELHLFSFAEEKPTFPNIDYIATGYNIFKGNPHSTRGPDPGITGIPVFEFTYAHGRTTLDLVHRVPDAVYVLSTPSCNFDFETITATDTSSYQTTIRASVEVQGSGFWGASFGASADFNSVKEGTKDRETTYTSSLARCTTYTVYVEDFSHLSFHKDFAKEVKNLLTEYNAKDENSPYISFIEKYGTHLISKLIMGGRFGILSSLDKQGMKSLSDKGFKASISAGYSGIVDVSASASTEVQKKQADAFNNARKSKRTFQVGGKPPPDFNGGTTLWAESVALNPVPIQYTLREIKTLFSKDFFPRDKDIEKKHHALQNAIFTYCNEYHKLEGCPTSYESGCTIMKCRSTPILPTGLTL